MFVIELIYKVDLAKIDAHMAAHMKFLKKHYASGNFLVSGRKIPRDGGIILATGGSRQEIENRQGRPVRRARARRVPGRRVQGQPAGRPAHVTAAFKPSR